MSGHEDTRDRLQLYFPQHITTQDAELALDSGSWRTQLSVKATTTHGCRSKRHGIFHYPSYQSILEYQSILDTLLPFFKI